jgi:hypothetical protein
MQIHKDFSKFELFLTPERSPDSLPEPTEVEKSKVRATHRGALALIGGAFVGYTLLVWWLS